MEIVTGYRGKPHITSEKWADLNRGIIGAEEYVLGVGRMFESELVSNNLLKIYDGCGVLQGRQFGTQAGQSDEITIENGTQGEKRIDLIVARYTKNEDTKVETIEPVLIKGTPSASDPAVPKHTEGNIRQGDLIADMPLYEVELNGINVVEVRPLFQVLMNMNKINKNLSDTSDKLKADYIVENYVSGDNSAMYRKWNSGLLEVWLASVTVVPVNIAWGNVFRSDNQVGKNYPEKAKFIAPPIVTMTVKTDLSDVAWITPKDSESKTRLPNYYLVRGARMDATAKYFINAYAVGRWK